MRDSNERCTDGAQADNNGDDRIHHSAQRSLTNRVLLRVTRSLSNLPGCIASHGTQVVYMPLRYPGGVYASQVPG